MFSHQSFDCIDCADSVKSLGVFLHYGFFDAHRNLLLIDSQITDEHDNQQLTVLDPAAIPFVSQQSSVLTT